MRDSAETHFTEFFRGKVGWVCATCCPAIKRNWRHSERSSESGPRHSLRISKAPKSVLEGLFEQFRLSACCFFHEYPYALLSLHMRYRHCHCQRGFQGC